MTEDMKANLVVLLILAFFIGGTVFAVNQGWLDRFVYKCPRGEYPVMARGGVICFPRQGG
jgi:hypothetical protein